jgi:putative oxidoreductase
LKQFGRAPDILINNLGVGNSTPFEDASDEIWARSFEVNLMGTVRTCRALVPQMAARSGAVVNTGSDLAKQPEPGFMEYGTCKAGLMYLTKALAKQYAPAVRVNMVCPVRSGLGCGRGRAVSSISWSNNTGSTGARR